MPEPKEDWVEIGRVLKPRGLKGELKVFLTCDGPEHFTQCIEKTGSIHVWPAGLPRPEEPPLLQIESLRFHEGNALIRFAGIHNLERAEPYRNHILGMPASQLPPTGENEYYYHELEGLDAVDETGAPLGAVIKIEDNLAHPMLVIQPGGGAKPFRVPFVDAFVKTVDLAAKRVELHLPPGLRDL